MTACMEKPENDIFRADLRGSLISCRRARRHKTQGLQRALSLHLDSFSVQSRSSDALECSADFFVDAESGCFILELTDFDFIGAQSDTFGSPQDLNQDKEVQRLFETMLRDGDSARIPSGSPFASAQCCVRD